MIQKETHSLRGSFFWLCVLIFLPTVFSYAQTDLPDRPAADQDSHVPLGDRIAGENSAAAKLRVRGLLQVWYGNGFGDAINGSNALNASLVPLGRNLGGRGREMLRFRRAQVALEGAPAPRMDFRLMLDASAPNADGASLLRDAWIGYRITPRLRLEIGQQKTGLSEEGTRDDGALLTVARAIMNEDLSLVAGRVGNVRSPGIALRYRGGPVQGFAGLWHGNGETPSGGNILHLRFLDGALYYKGIRYVTVGVWGGTHVGLAQPAEGRDRAGGTFILRCGPHLFEGEAAYARDHTAGAPGTERTGTISNGFNFLYAHTLSRKWQLVARYEFWNPDENEAAAKTGAPGVTENGVTLMNFDHKLKEYTFGINYYMPAQHAKIQVNYIRVDSEVNAPVFFGKQRTVLLANIQVIF